MDERSQRQRSTKIATGGLSHLIGAYYLIGGLICNCNAHEDKEMKQILLHLKGVYWSIMKMKYGIENPKRDSIVRPVRPKYQGGKIEMGGDE